MKNKKFILKDDETSDDDQICVYDPDDGPYILMINSQSSLRLAEVARLKKFLEKIIGHQSELKAKRKLRGKSK